MNSDSAVQARTELLDVARRLRRAAATAASRAAALQRPVLAWAAVHIAPLDPLVVFARHSSSDRIFWTRPDERFGLVGLGRAREFTFHGSARFDNAAAAWRACAANAVGDAPHAYAAGVLALGGFAFNPDGSGGEDWRGFPAGAIVVPRVCIYTSGDENWLILAVAVDPDGASEIDALVMELDRIAGDLEGLPREVSTDSGGAVLEELPSGEVWRGSVAGAVQAAREGLLRKVVLARALRVRDVRVRATTGLASLRRDYPNCAIFAVSRAGGCFIGATPERLVRIHQGRVTTMAVAGSAPRGVSLDEDRRLGEALLKSPKDRLEHAVVVDVLRDVISEACDDVTTTPAPTLLKLSNIQHLLTPLAGRLREDVSVIELAGRLHPTPAVGGFPRERALRWLDEHEGLDRGWYAGPVGWLDGRGQGEFAVAIRSALLRGDEALLFAGCGIMADSDPDQEYAESWLKLRPILSALEIRHDGA